MRDPQAGLESMERRRVALRGATWLGACVGVLVAFVASCMVPGPTLELMVRQPLLLQLVGRSRDIHDPQAALRRGIGAIAEVELGALALARVLIDVVADLLVAPARLADRGGAVVDPGHQQGSYQQGPYQQVGIKVRTAVLA
jgi:hypothetical protein